MARPGSRPENRADRQHGSVWRRACQGTALLCAASILGAGCESSNKGMTSSVTAIGKKGFDQGQLLSGTNRLLEEMYVGAVNVSGDAAVATRSLGIREDTLRWRIQVATRIDSLRQVPDIRVRFIGMLILATQLRIDLNRPGTPRFGDQQPAFAEWSRQFEESAYALAYAVFSKEGVDAAKPQIEKAAMDPLAVNWSDPSGVKIRVSDSRSRDPISTLLSIPMAPITGLEGVGNTPEAIHYFADATRDVGRVIQHLPERTRWQTELFLLEAAANGPVPDLIKESGRMREEVASIQKTVEQLPAQVRQETDAAIKSAASSLPEFQKTIKEAHDALQVANATAEQVNTAVQSIRGTINDLGPAAAAVQAAAAESKALVVELNKEPPKSPTTQPAKEKESEGIRIAEVEAAARAIDSAAKEVRGVLGDLSGNKLSPALTNATVQFDDAVSRLAWRIGELIVLLFGCALLYRVISGRLVTREVMRRRNLRRGA